MHAKCVENMFQILCSACLPCHFKKRINPIGTTPAEDKGGEIKRRKEKVCQTQEPIFLHRLDQYTR
jgi:hypothetical protein